MKAFHGKRSIKAKYIRRVRLHRESDELVKGQYWENGKGCAVGCTVHSGDHSAYERELGIPRVIARLEDGIFERLPNGKAQAWPERFLKAIPVGADLSLVWPKFAVWLMVDKKHGVIQYARTEKSKSAIQAVADGYSELLKNPDAKIDWCRLRRAADAAAYAAAYAAYAADDADDADDAAAYAAAYAAADAAAAAASKIAQTNKLIELLQKQPTTGEKP